MKPEFVDNRNGGHDVGGMRGRLTVPRQAACRVDGDSIMTTEGERVARFLDDCAALLDEYSNTFPRPGSDGGAAMDFADQTLWLAKDHGLRTIRGMNRLLRDDEGNAVLTCAAATLLRAFRSPPVGFAQG